MWTRVNALDSPWVLDDLTTLVTEIGDKLDVIMVPKVQGPEDIHYVDRLLAQLEAKAGLTRPILIHAILETARGMANVEQICFASPRMQGLSLGPADLAADRRMKTTRVGGGHPGYLVRQDPPGGDIAAEQEGVTELVLTGDDVLDVAERAVVGEDPGHRAGNDHPGDRVVPVSYTHLTLPTNREV